MVTLIEGVQPLIKERQTREIEKDNFMTKSDMVIKSQKRFLIGFQTINSLFSKNL
jgi:hypothetical protein